MTTLSSLNTVTFWDPGGLQSMNSRGHNSVHNKLKRPFRLRFCERFLPTAFAILAECLTALGDEWERELEVVSSTKGRTTLITSGMKHKQIIIVNFSKAVVMSKVLVIALCVVSNHLIQFMTLIKSLTWGPSPMVNPCKCARASIPFVSKEKTEARQWWRFFFLQEIRLMNRTN